MSVYDTTYGNLDILLINIGILTASSGCIVNLHIRVSLADYWLTMLLGTAFIVNQLDETYTIASVDAYTELTAMLSTFYIHLSHLVICLILLTGMFFQHSMSLAGSDNALLVAVLYWHLVEVVWVFILVFLMTY